MTLEALTRLLINSPSFLPQTHISCGPVRVSLKLCKHWDPIEKFSQSGSRANENRLYTLVMWGLKRLWSFASSVVGGGIFLRSSDSHESVSQDHTILLFVTLITANLNTQWDQILIILIHIQRNSLLVFTFVSVPHPMVKKQTH